MAEDFGGFEARPERYLVALQFGRNLGHRTGHERVDQQHAESMALFGIADEMSRVIAGKIFRLATDEPAQPLERTLGAGMDIKIALVGASVSTPGSP